MGKFITRWAAQLIKNILDGVHCKCITCVFVAKGADECVYKTRRTGAGSVGSSHELLVSPWTGDRW